MGTGYRVRVLLDLPSLLISSKKLQVGEEGTDFSLVLKGHGY